MSKDLR